MGVGVERWPFWPKSFLQKRLNMVCLMVVELVVRMRVVVLFEAMFTRTEKGRLSLGYANPNPYSKCERPLGMEVTMEGMCSCR